MSLAFYTIGHSTRSIDKFVALLHVANIELIVDIRTIPKSRTNPQYNKDVLPITLLSFGINYIYIAELGGLRSKAKAVQPEVNGFWNNKSFHNYADYALSDSFHRGFNKLIELGETKNCALMCSEAVWWRCHRRIVSDYLLAQGKVVFHLMERDCIKRASLTQGAWITPSNKVVYPAIS